ncbi:hypothetical protein KFU94_69425 [Chloroflexi bacterium TSY]|nr:hypothetical protein [Chloroflexi bacterium TSY]
MENLSQNFLQFSSEQLTNEIDSFLDFLEGEQKKCFGIQINQDVSDCQIFAPLLSHTLNNLGDPFTGNGGHLVTFDYERELVELVSFFLNLKSSEAWGYYTSGSTISNLHGVHLGMRSFDEPALVISEEAHNSCEKAATITRCQHVVKVKTDQSGKMLTDDFEEQLKKCPSKNYIFVFCSGTVAKGAYDDADELLKVIHSLGIDKSDYYLHIDAALGGLITPFLSSNPIRLDFRIKEADSLSVSFHKRLGIPIPGSLFIVRKKVLENLPPSLYAEHYLSHDTTISGSRDGFSPFVTLMKLKRIGYNGMVERTDAVLKKARWFVNLLREQGVDAWRNRYSPCVVLPAPSAQLMKEYHLPLYSSPKGRYTHIFTMEHITEIAMASFLEKYLTAST